MFESIGRVRDEEETRRRAVALGILASVTAFVTVLVLILPDPAPPPAEVGLPIVKDWPTDEPEIEIELMAPTYQAPAPAGGGVDAVEPLPQDRSYAVQPLTEVVSQKLATTPQTGKGPGTGPGIGPGGEGTGKTPCPEGAPCGIGGGGTGMDHEVEVDTMIEPRYPATAKQMGLGDERCIADVAIDSEGRVVDVAVSACSPVFHSSVEKALSKWRFVPVRTSSGAKVGTRTRIAIWFRRGSR